MAITMQNNLRGASNYDADYVLADTQSVSADAAGNIAAGYIDLADYAGSQWVGHLRFTAADYTTGDEAYEIQIQTSAATNFSTYNTEKTVSVPITATVATGTYFNIGAFSPTRRYLRVYFNVGGTSPSMTVDKVWISPV